MDTEHINKAKLAFSRKHPDLAADDAADLVEDGWILLELAGPPDAKGDPVRSIGFVLACAHNLYLKHLRRRKRLSSLDEAREHGFDVAISGDHDDQLVDAQLLESLFAALDPIEGKILRMKSLEGFKYDEIALALQMTRAAVKKRYERAFKKLQQIASRGGGDNYF